MFRLVCLLQSADAASSIITLDTKLDITFFEGMKTEYIPETDLRVKDAVGKNYWDVFPWGHTLGMAEKMNQIMTGEEVGFYHYLMSTRLIPSPDRYQL